MKDPFFLTNLPFFGFLFLLVFAGLLTCFFYRARGSFAIYYLSFVALALSCGEIWLWFRMAPAPSAAFVDNHYRYDTELGYAMTSGPRRTQSIMRSRLGSLIYDVSYDIDDHGIRRTPQKI